jgi:hypothetical protein
MQLLRRHSVALLAALLAAAVAIPGRASRGVVGRGRGLVGDRRDGRDRRDRGGGGVSS